ncbi:hypothetical protein ACLHZN_26160 [Escherichia coli]
MGPVIHGIVRAGAGVVRRERRAGKQTRQGECRDLVHVHDASPAIFSGGTQVPAAGLARGFLASLYKT